MALELEDTDLALLTLYIDASGELQARHATTELSEHRDHVLVRSAEDAITFVLSAPADTIVKATHEDDDGETVSWKSTAAGVHYKFGDPTTDPLEITVSTAPAATEETTDPPKTKVLRVEAKPGGALPDRA